AVALEQVPARGTEPQLSEIAMRRQSNGAGEEPDQPILTRPDGRGELLETQVGRVLLAHECSDFPEGGPVRRRASAPKLVFAALQRHHPAEQPDQLLVPLQRIM